MVEMIQEVTLGDTGSAEVRPSDTGESAAWAEAKRRGRPGVDARSAAPRTTQRACCRQRVRRHGCAFQHAWGQGAAAITQRSDRVFFPHVTVGDVGCPCRPEYAGPPERDFGLDPRFALLGGVCWPPPPLPKRCRTHNSRIPSRWSAKAAQEQRSFQDDCGTQRYRKDGQRSTKSVESRCGSARVNRSNKR